MADRNTYRYLLKNSNQIVYVGITNDPARRIDEHSIDGKNFTHMTIEGPIVSRGSAERWEQDRIDIYSRNHSGYSPKYNKQ